MPAWSDVGFVLLVGTGVMVTIELLKLLLRKRPGLLSRTASAAA
jgi:hypothetical protein